jgi:hypothetical protein
MQRSVVSLEYTDVSDARTASISRAMMGKRRYSSYSLSTSALDGVSGQFHAPDALYPRERTPGSHCTGGWVGPRDGLFREA